MYYMSKVRDNCEIISILVSRIDLPDRERSLSMQKVPDFNPSSESVFSKNLKMTLQLVCVTDSSETTTAISKAVGFDH